MVFTYFTYSHIYYLQLQSVVKHPSDKAREELGERQVAEAQRSIRGVCPHSTAALNEVAPGSTNEAHDK